ncbi:Protein adenylyltransferase SelO, partial [Dissostichus eleginoides]
GGGRRGQRRRADIAQPLRGRGGLGSPLHFGADSPGPPGSRDWRERWSQKAYQKSIHNGPHYSFKRRSHSPLQPSHHPAPENHSAILLLRLS